MAQNPAVTDSCFKYLDRKGNLLKTRTELTISQMLDFLGVPYEHDVSVDGTDVRAEFGTERGLIKVVSSGSDMEEYKSIREAAAGRRVMAVGSPRHAAKIGELEEMVFYDKAPQTGSIFLDDASFSFDYAHILPLVEKCSILHGHTSRVMVELIGQMKDNLLVDFGMAKKIVKEIIDEFDHKFFINGRYVESRDSTHCTVRFDGPRGRFELSVPADTTYVLDGEATVESLSEEIVRLLAPKMPSNVEAVGVYIYEGYNKGSHIISNISG